MTSAVGKELRVGISERRRGCVIMLRESEVACLRGSEICYCFFLCDRQSGTRKSTNFHGPSKTGYFRFPLLCGFWDG